MERAREREGVSMTLGNAGRPREGVRAGGRVGRALLCAAVVLGAIDVRHVAGLSMDFLGCVLLEKKPNGEWIHLAGEFEKHVPGR